jgi:ubiquinone/menaquinone biosynthesis C-methylase UbiE
MNGAVNGPDHLAATQAAYDDTADVYATLIGTEISSEIEGPFDRATLAGFVEFIDDKAGLPVADVGCGPGRVAAFLAQRGLDVIGIDISPAMLSIARNAHPGIRFEEGRLTCLPCSDSSLAGIVCWYSIIHTRADDLDAVFTELARVLIPNGCLLLAFQSGLGEQIDRNSIYRRPVSLTSYRHSAEVVVSHLSTAGFHIHLRAERQPELSHESTPQTFLVARLEALQSS